MRAGSRSLPSAPQSIADPVSETDSAFSSNVEVQEDAMPNFQSSTGLVLSKIDNPASTPESEDELQEPEPGEPPARPAK